MPEPAPSRRRRYRAGIANPDRLIVRGLDRFLAPTLRDLVRAGHRVVDVGCGEQPLRAQVEALGAAYTGVDVAQNGAGTVAVVAPADRVPLPDGSFDVVLCTEVLEHVPDASAAFRELVRLAAPGGHVVITIPFVYRLHEEPHDFRRATPHQVRAWAAAEGADAVRLETLGDEALVLGTVWAGIWDQQPRPSNVVARVALRTAQRIAIACGNLAAVAASSLFRAWLPRKYALSVAAVLRKRTGGAASR